MTTYNPALIGKLLNRAGHPGTPDFEALSAVRKAYSLCSAKGVTLGDVANFVNGELFVEITDFSKRRFLEQIAELQIGKDDAEARIVVQADVIADLRQSEEANVSSIATLQMGREVDASTIAALEAKITSLNETVARQREALAAASAVATQPVVEPTTTAIEEPVAEKTVRRRAAAKRTTSTGVRRSARITAPELDESGADTSANEAAEPDTSFDTPSRSLAEWARFNVLAALGRASSSIARTLSREFDRRVTNADIGKMRRNRWLSPDYGLA